MVVVTVVASVEAGRGGRAAPLSRGLYTAGLVLSALVGVLHFFAPYAFAWYAYIPDAPREITVSIDYINFLFSVMLTGLSVILLCLRRRAFEGSTEVLAFYVFLVFVWLCRVLVSLVVPWPTPLQTWLLTGVVTIFVLLLLPCIPLARRTAAGP